ncbi:MAG: efflux RND transporter periplasmic adaptor subunit [Syntrophobacteraceae bacterium]
MSAKPNEEPDIAGILEIGQSPGKEKSRKRLVISAILAAAAVLAAVVFWKSSNSSSAVHYKTQEAQRGDLTVIVTATGTLQATNEVDVSTELSGIIKTIEVDYNSKVKVGQVLAKLDTLKLEAQVTQSKAALESAKAKVLQTQATVRETRSKLSQLRRVRELSNNKVPSQAEIDAAEAALDRASADVAGAKAAVSQAQATLDSHQTDLSKAAIRSPINGIVLTRKMEPGQTVAATLDPPVLFKLAEDLTQMELIVNVDEADVGHIQEGQNATFSVAAYPNRTFEARIVQARFGSTTTSGVVTYETVLKVDNPDLALRPGMTATADIVVKNIKNAVLIPAAALRFAPPVQEEKKPSTSLIGSILPRPPGSKIQQRDVTSGTKQQRVWTLSDGRLTAIPVKIGAAGGGLTEVVSGDIQPGMAVVVDTVSSVQ